MGASPPVVRMPDLGWRLASRPSSPAISLWYGNSIGSDVILKHLVSLVADLRQRKVGLNVLAGTGAHIDTTTANGRLVFGIFAALAEFEAELIRERTCAGLAAARARGRLGGRPRKMTEAVLHMAMSAMAAPTANASEIAWRLGMTTTTLYEYVNGDGSLKQAGQALFDRDG